RPSGSTPSLSGPSATRPIPTPRPLPPPATTSEPERESRASRSPRTMSPGTAVPAATKPEGRNPFRRRTDSAIILHIGRAGPWDPDVRDLERSLHRIEAELRGDLDRLLVRRLVTVLNRGCPLRTVAPSPFKDTARIGFADGLSVLAHS